MGPGSARVPAGVQWARVLLAAIAVGHLVVPVVMWLDRDRLVEQIAARNPGFSAEEIGRSTDVALIAATAFHGVLLIVCVLLVWKLAAGRPWARWLATVTQLLSVVFGVVSWSSSPMFHVVIPLIAAAQLLLVALLWIGRPVREFFARPR